MEEFRELSSSSLYKNNLAMQDCFCLIHSESYSVFQLFSIRTQVVCQELRIESIFLFRCKLLFLCRKSFDLLSFDDFWVKLMLKPFPNFLAVFFKTGIDGKDGVTVSHLSNEIIRSCKVTKLLRYTQKNVNFTVHVYAFSETIWFLILASKFNRRCPSIIKNLRIVELLNISRYTISNCQNLPFFLLNYRYFSAHSVWVGWPIWSDEMIFDN